MIEIFSAIARMAVTVSITAAPLSWPSLAPFTAVCSSARLLSAFLAIEALICSRLDVVSSTAAACSLVPCDSVCDVDDTCEAAEPSALAPERTSPITCDNLAIMFWSAVPSASFTDCGVTVPVRSPCAMRTAASTFSLVAMIMRLMASSSWPISSREAEPSCTSTSPSATRLAARTARSNGVVIERPIMRLSATPTISAMSSAIRGSTTALLMRDATTGAAASIAREWAVA